jgi:mono/diheme cytochrome c family protein
MVMYKRIPSMICCIAASCWLVSFQTGDLAKSIKRGEEVYTTSCVTCHQPNGEGLEGAFPPLAKADFLVKDKDGKKSIGVILNGQNGEITVNGKKYNTEMPTQSFLTDEQIADVLNYARNTWGNKAKAITPALVKAERK